MKKKWSNTLLASVLAVMLVVGQAGLSAFAENNAPENSGNQSSETTDLNTSNLPSPGEGENSSTPSEGEGNQNTAPAPTPGEGENSSTPSEGEGNQNTTPTPTPEGGGNSSTSGEGEGNQNTTPAPTPGEGENSSTPSEGEGNQNTTPTPTPEEGGTSTVPGEGEGNQNTTPDPAPEEGDAVKPADPTAPDDGNTNPGTNNSAKEGTVLSAALTDPASAEKTVSIGTAKEQLNLPKTVKVSVQTAKQNEDGTPALDENGAQVLEAVEKEIEITWENSDYNAEVAGTYLFTAKLPDGYTLAEGVALPTVKVIVSEPEIKYSTEVLQSEPAGYAADSDLPYFSAFSWQESASSGKFGDQLTGYSKQYYDALCNMTPAIEYKSAEVTFSPPLAVTFDIIREGTAEPKVVLNTESRRVLSEITQPAYNAYAYDDPANFWVGRGIDNGYSYTIDGITIPDGASTVTGKINSVLAKGESTYSNPAGMVSALNSAVSSVAGGLPGSSSYEVAKQIHDWIAGQVTYNHEAANSGSTNGFEYAYEAFGVFDEQYRSVVCEGYAKAFKMLCDEKRIPCVLVVGTLNASGTSKGGPHMWNYVQMDDGKWYAVDVTNDDRSSIIYDLFLCGSNTQLPNFGNKTFGTFCTPSGQFSQNATIVFSYPALEQNAYNPANTPAWTLTASSASAGSWTDSDVTVTLSVANGSTTPTDPVTFEVSTSADNSQWSDWLGESITVTGSNGNYTYTISNNTNQFYRFRAKIGEDYSSIAVLNKKVMIDKNEPTAAICEFDQTKWYNAAQTVTATFTKSAGECPEWLEYTLSLDGTSNYQKYPESGVQVDGADGEHIVSFRVMDEMNRKSAVSQIKVRIDKTKPAIGTITVAATTDPLDNANPAIALYNIVTNKKVTATATVTDSGSDVKEVQYALVPDGGTEGPKQTVSKDSTTGNYIATIDSNFKGTVKFYAADNAGNEAEPKSSDAITAENIVPAITIGGDTEKYYKGGDKIPVTVQDTGIASGIKTVTYQFDSGTAVTARVSSGKFEAAIPESITGATTTLKVVATDQAGNKTEETKDLKIDNVVPVFSVIPETIKADDSTATAYTYNSAAPTELNIRFTLAQPVANASGVKYYYTYGDENATQPNSDWKELKGTVLNVEETCHRTYFFKAISGSGKESDLTTPVSQKVYISKPVPKAVSVKVTGVVDKWTNQNVKFELSDGFQDMNILKGYQYTTTQSGEPQNNATWTDVPAGGLEVTAEDNKYYWFRAVSNAGSTGGMSSGYHVMIDKTEPVASTFTSSDLTDNSAKVSFDANEAGTYYYVNQLSTETAPDAAAVKNSGTKGTAKNGKNEISITGLDAFTDYKIYIVVEDAAGNLSAVLDGAYKTTKLNLTATIQSKNKEYDGTDDATSLVTVTLSGTKPGHIVTGKVTKAVFNSKDAGKREVTVQPSEITLEGVDADKYEWPAAGAEELTANAEITKKKISIDPASIAVKNKPFDGKTTAALIGTVAFQNAVAGETVAYNTQAVFEDANVGTAKKVTVKVTLTGNSAANYTLESSEVISSADITKASNLTASYQGKLLMKENAEKDYTFDLSQISLGQSNAGTLSYAVSAPTGDSIFKTAPEVKENQLTYTSSSSAVSGNTAAVTVTVSSQNYDDTNVTLYFEVVKKDVVAITGITVAGNGKTYDGKPVSYTGTVPGYTGTLDYVWSRTDAPAVALSEAPKDAGNYLLTVSIPAENADYTGSAAIPFTIQKAPLKLVAADYTCYEDTDASVIKPSYRYIGFVNEETETEVFGTSKPTLTHGQKGTLSAGEYTITFSSVPTAPNNYEVTTQNGTLIVKQLEKEKIIEKTPEIKVTISGTETEIKIVREEVTPVQKEIVKDAINTTSHFEGIPESNVEILDLVPINADTKEVVDIAAIGETIAILIPYPAGSNRNDTFVVLHLKNGTDPEVISSYTATENGLQCDVSSLSPFAVGYQKAVTPPTPPVDNNDNNNNNWISGGTGGTSSGGSSSDRDSSSSSSSSSDRTSISGTEQKFWNTVLNQLKKSEDGDTINVNAKSYDRVPVSILKAIQGKDVTLNIKWKGGEDISINGLDVITPEATRRYYPITKLLELYQETPSKKTSKPAKKAEEGQDEPDNQSQADNNVEGSADGNSSGGTGGSSYTAEDGTTVQTKENPNTGLIVDISAPDAADIDNAPITPAEHGIPSDTVPAESGMNIGFLIAAIAAVMAAGAILFFSLKKIQR